MSYVFDTQPSLCERISVHAIFPTHGRKIMPISFRRQNYEYKITTVTYTWKTQKGDITYIHFAVSNSTHSYELVFNTTAFTWHLYNIYDNDEFPRNTPFF
jgi:hypothetical protein